MGNTNELSAEDYPQLWLMLDKLHLDLMVQHIRAIHRKDNNKARDYNKKLKKVECVMGMVEKDYGHFRERREPVVAKKRAAKPCKAGYSAIPDSGNLAAERTAAG